MATMLDRKFVKATLDNVRSLANEVERLECYVRSLERRVPPEQLADASSEAAKEWQSMDPITLS